MYRMVDCGTWDDPWFAELEPDAKLLFLYLVTNRRSTSCGAFEITERQMAFETGIPQKRVSEILAAFAPRVRWWSEHRVIWLSNFYKHQSSSDKFKLNAQRMAADFAYEVRIAIYRRYPELQHPNDPLSIEGDAPSIGYPKPIHGLSAVKEEVKGEEIAEGIAVAEETAAADAAPPSPPVQLHPVSDLAKETAEVLVNAPWVNDQASDVAMAVDRSFTLVPDFPSRDAPLLAEQYVRWKGYRKKPPEDWYRAWLNWVKKERQSERKDSTSGNRPHAVNGRSSSDPASQMGGGGDDAYTSGRFGHLVQKAASI